MAEHKAFAIILIWMCISTIGFSLAEGTNENTVSLYVEYLPKVLIFASSHWVTFMDDC